MTVQRRMVATTRTEATPRARFAEIPWTRPGPVAESESPAVTPASNITIIGLSATLTTPGSGYTIVQLRKNGEAIVDVTINDGETYAFQEGFTLQLIGRRDTYSIAVIMAGDGAVDLSGSIELAS